MSHAPFVLAAGGTGGHLFPAEALARALSERGRKTCLFVDRRAHDYLGPIRGVDIRTVSAGNPSSGGWAGRAGAALRLAAGTMEARSALQKLRPGLVIGFGGYPSLPTVSAALSLRVPVLLHEQNAVLGRANRIFAGRAVLIAGSFGGATLQSWPGGVRDRVIVTGNPVRPAIAALARSPYAPPDEDGPIRLVIFGGSQGARILSEVVPSALSALPTAARTRLRIVQQCRPGDLDRAGLIYRNAGIEVTLTPFIRDMPDRLAEAHLVISRAGASTISELTAIGRPAVLVPYPHAMDDHQTANARALDQAGAAWILPDRELTPAALAKQLQRLVSGPHRLAVAAEASARLGMPDAVNALADLAERLSPSSSQTGIRGARDGFGAKSMFLNRQEAA